jgi:hypothetical protein
MTQPISGRCLCGAVTITLDSFDGHVGACHCGMCRRWNGAPSLSVNGGKALRISGEAHVRRYRSSDWAERCFCERCGSNLFYRLLKEGEHFVSAGLFDALPGAVLERQIFIDHKPDWYEFANATTNETEAEVFAKFAPPPD